MLLFCSAAMTCAARWVADGINVYAADVVGGVVFAELVDRAAWGLHDPHRMIWVFLVDDVVGANERRDGFLAPLRLVLTLPHAEARVIAERADDSAKLFLSHRMCVVDGRKFLEPWQAIHASPGGRVHVLFLAGDPGIVPSRFRPPSKSRIGPGANEHGAGVAKLFQGKLSVGGLGVWRRWNSEADRENLRAVDRQQLLRRDLNFAWAWCSARRPQWLYIASRCKVQRKQFDTLSSACWAVAIGNANNT